MIKSWFVPERPFLKIAITRVNNFLCFVFLEQGVAFLRAPILFLFDG